MQTMLSRVALGAAVLDRKCPGWVSKIDLSTLDLSSAYYCAIAQVFETKYGLGRQLLGIDDRGMCYERGFWECDVTDPRYKERYVALTHMWREEIERRRDTRSAAAA